MVSRAIGVDFGTTNSAVAVAEADGSVRLARFPSRLGERTTFRSILYFHREEDIDDGAPTLARGVAAFAGPRAIERYLDTVGTGRLVQSLKSYLADHSFDATNLFGRTTTLHELVSYLARAVRTDAVATLGQLDGPVVVGRPVHFVGSDGTAEGDAFAVKRLRTALAAAGFGDDVTLEYEPVAAAYHYESRLDHDERILVADFGGGTSDFTLIEVGPKARKAGARPILATGGVGLAGDALDARILHHVVSPALGLGSHYKSMMGKELEVPVWIYARLRRWHLLSFLRTKKILDLLAEMESQTDDTEKITALRHVVENDLGYKLYESVERTKVALSTSEETRLIFEDDPLHLDVPVRRADFERWISEELQSIGTCVDGVLARANLTAEDVDRVFMTGGTSLVPAVHALFAGRFGAGKIAAGDELTSVASGLALRAATRG
jgi:hypothetical chaperone protein